jgi:hypothetical protein
MPNPVETRKPGEPREPEPLPHLDRRAALRGLLALSLAFTLAGCSDQELTSWAATPTEPVPVMPTAEPTVSLAEQGPGPSPTEVAAESSSLHEIAMSPAYVKEYLARDQTVPAEIFQDPESSKMYEDRERWFAEQGLPNCEAKVITNTYSGDDFRWDVIPVDRTSGDLLGWMMIEVGQDQWKMAQRPSWDYTHRPTEYRYRFALPEKNNPSDKFAVVYSGLDTWSLVETDKDDNPLRWFDYETQDWVVFEGVELTSPELQRLQEEIAASIAEGYTLRGSYEIRGASIYETTTNREMVRFEGNKAIWYLSDGSIYEGEASQVRVVNYDRGRYKPFVGGGAPDGEYYPPEPVSYLAEVDNERTWQFAPDEQYPEGLEIPFVTHLMVEDIAEALPEPQYGLAPTREENLLWQYYSQDSVEVFRDMEYAHVKSIRDESGWPDEYIFIPIRWPQGVHTPWLGGWYAIQKGANQPPVAIDFYILLQRVGSDRVIDWFGLPMERQPQVETGPRKTVRVVWNLLYDNQASRAWVAANNRDMTHLDDYYTHLVNGDYRLLNLLVHDPEGPENTPVVQEQGWEEMKRFVERQGGNLGSGYMFGNYISEFFLGESVWDLFRDRSYNEINASFDGLLSIEFYQH